MKQRKTDEEMVAAISEWLKNADPWRLRHIYDGLFPCKHTSGAERSGDSLCCKDCGGDFGWYCPNSPDHKCYYYSEEIDGKRGVTLMNGTFFVLTSGSKQDESDDWCIFCNGPEERK